MYIRANHRKNNTSTDTYPKKDKKYSMSPYIKFISNRR